MTRRTLGAALLAASTLMATTAAVAATPAGTKTTTKPSIKMLSGFSFVPNRYTQDKTRFDQDVYSLKSGVTISIRNTSSDEPHTLSIVKKSQVPKTPRTLGGCFEGGVCGALAQAHQFPEGEGPPAVPVVNKGADGLDTTGDSVFFNPNQRRSLKLTAKKGTTLNFICIIHPWMQAQIRVR
jgi:plastocyanin